MTKKLHLLGSKNEICNGVIGKYQRQFCKDCKHSFTSRKQLDVHILYEDYVTGKQNLLQLAEKYQWFCQHYPAQIAYRTFDKDRIQKQGCGCPDGCHLLVDIILE